METQITVTLREEVLQRAEFWAQRSGRSVADWLAETIEVSLQPLGSPPEGERPLTEWADDEVQAAADADMNSADDRRLSELLHRQQAHLLTEAEPSELLARMHLYQQGLLRKAQALREAVRRGLREPLQP